MQAAADELQQELGKPYLRAYPCCSCAGDYKAALKDRKLKYTTIPEAQKALPEHCQEGVLLEDSVTS